MLRGPGPASSVVERSLRKSLCARGPRFESRRRIYLFRRVSSRIRTFVWRNFQQIGRDNQSRNLLKREAVATPSLSERDVARINWPLWRHPWCMTSYVTYYDILHKNEPATCHNNKPQSLICDGDRPLIGSRPRTDRRFLSYQYDEVAGREQEGG